MHIAKYKETQGNFESCVGCVKEFYLELYDQMMRKCPTIGIPSNSAVGLDEFKNELYAFIYAIAWSETDKNCELSDLIAGRCRDAGEYLFKKFSKPELPSVEDMIDCYEEAMQAGDHHTEAMVRVHDLLEKGKV